MITTQGKPLGIGTVIVCLHINFSSLTLCLLDIIFFLVKYSCYTWLISFHYASKLLIFDFSKRFMEISMRFLLLAQGGRQDY